MKAWVTLAVLVVGFAVLASATLPVTARPAPQLTPQVYIPLHLIPCSHGGYCYGPPTGTPEPTRTARPRLLPVATSAPRP